MRNLIIFLWVFTASHTIASELKIVAEPGGIYILPDSIIDTKIIITGTGNFQSPFKLVGSKNRTKMLGNSLILCRASHVVVERIEFENNLIKYKANNDALIILGGWKDDISHIVIKDVQFLFSTEEFEDKDKETQFYWIKISSSNSRIDNCIFEGKRNRLPIIHVDSDKQDNVISNCTFRNVPSRQGEALEAIRIGLMSGSSNCKIVDNYFHKYNGDSETISCKADSVYLAGNKFVDCRSGIVIRWGDACVITNNTFINTATAIRLTGRDHVIKNNRFSNALYGDIVFMKGGEAYRRVENVSITGNTFLSNAKFAVIENNDSDVYPNKIHLTKNYTTRGKRRSRLRNTTLNSEYFKSDVGNFERRSTGLEFRTYELK